MIINEQINKSDFYQISYVPRVLTRDVCHDFVFQVACETMLSGPHLLANLRNTAGKRNKFSI